MRNSRKRTGEFCFEICRRPDRADLHAGPMRLERAGIRRSAEGSREALVRRSTFPPAMRRWHPAARVKFGPDRQRIFYGPPGPACSGRNGDLASVFPKEDARAPLMKPWTPDSRFRCGRHWPQGRHQRPCSSAASMRSSASAGHADLRRGQDRPISPRGEFVMLGMYISFFLSSQFRQSTPSFFAACLRCRLLFRVRPC